MKNFRKSIFLMFLGLICMSCLSACTSSKMLGIPNPWTDCQEDLIKAAKIAGFTFPIEVKDYNVQAMKNMIEITFPLDNKRDLIIRKSSLEINNGDISGDYNSYPQVQNTTLKNGVNITLRRDEKFVYVMYFAAEQGYYSINCPKGMTLDEVEKIYELIAKYEAPKLPPEAD